MREMFLPEKGISSNPFLSVFLQQKEPRSILLLLRLPEKPPSLEEGAGCFFVFLQSLQACLESLPSSLATPWLPKSVDRPTCQQIHQSPGGRLGNPPGDLTEAPPSFPMAPFPFSQVDPQMLGFYNCNNSPPSE